VEKRGKKKRAYVVLTIRVPQEIAARLDEYCNAFGLMRSEVIRQALVSFLQEKTGWRHALA